jgi:hypothetical protein
VIERTLGCTNGICDEGKGGRVIFDHKSETQSQ